MSLCASSLRYVDVLKGLLYIALNKAMINETQKFYFIAKLLYP